MERGLRAALLALAAMLCACTLGPHYQRSTVPTPRSWSGTAGEAATHFELTSAPLAAWWRDFHDPELDRLVSAALRDNLDIRAAAARIVQAREQRNETAAALLPTLNAKAEAQRYGIPRAIREQIDGAESSLEKGGTLAAGTTLPRVPSYLDLYQLGFDASWELDLFGGTRRAVEAANAQTQAAIAARRGAVVSVLAELGNDYAQLRATQARLAVTERTVSIEQGLLDLTESQRMAGLASDVDVAQAQSQLASMRAGLPPLQQQVLASIHAIAVLVGQLPESLESELGVAAAVPASPPTVPIGLPSTVLTQRPDIAQAERTLAAATAQIGVAQAARFPNISLTGSAALASTELDRLLRAGNFYYSLGGSLTAPLFDAGRLAAAHRAAIAAAQVAQLQYQKTVLQAFAETEDALRGYDAELAQLRDLEAARDASRRALERATDLFERGVASYLQVLTADQSLAALEGQIAQAEGARVQALVTLYKALGGGWQVSELAAAQGSPGGG
jgi:NodT family efflux transporter outer membrane factor (OMF) lipoprotein